METGAIVLGAGVPAGATLTKPRGGGSFATAEIAGTLDGIPDKGVPGGSPDQLYVRCLFRRPT